jgi:hypothetical protein
VSNYSYKITKTLSNFDSEGNPSYLCYITLLRVLLLWSRLTRNGYGRKLLCFLWIICLYIYRMFLTINGDCFTKPLLASWCLQWRRCISVRQKLNVVHVLSKIVFLWAVNFIRECFHKNKQKYVEERYQNCECICSAYQHVYFSNVVTLTL